MKKSVLVPLFMLWITLHATAQQDADAGQWKTWFIASGKEYRLPPPPAYKDEVAQVLSAQNKLDAAGMQKIAYWNAGAPGYRWYNMMFKLWTSGITGNGALANALIGTAIYDATVAAWDTKYAHNRPRPFMADSDIKLYAPKPETPFVSL